MEPTTITAAFIFALHMLKTEYGVTTCPQYISPPAVVCVDGMLSVRGRPIRAGYYRHGTGVLKISSLVCKWETAGAYVAHEATHYLQEKCGIPFNEEQAYAVQYAWSDR